MELALFPGQGSQQIGMGKDLCEQFSAARKTFEEASDAVSLDLKKLCFEGPESDLTLTENLQPALLTVSTAAFRVAQNETGYRPDRVAGHSLGEYSALVAAGAFPLEAATRWVRARGQAMQAAVPVGQGAMAAMLSLEDATVTTICERASEQAQKTGSKNEIVEPANFNSPGQVVVAGSRHAVDVAIELATSKEFGGKAKKLDVSAPFHCRLMKPARDRMAALFADAPPEHRPKKLLSPYIPNRLAQGSDDVEQIFARLEEQVDHPVLWSQSMNWALQSEPSDNRRMTEFGTGRVLTGLAKRIARTSKIGVELVNINVTEDLTKLGERK